MWLLLIVLSATKFESPVCKGGSMGSRFKDRDESNRSRRKRGCRSRRCRRGRLSRRCQLLRWVSIGRLQRRHLLRSDEQRRGKRVSAGLLQHGKRVLKRLNDVQKGQGSLVFVAAEKVALQTFGKEIMEPMAMKALMFFNCCQRARWRACLLFRSFGWSSEPCLEFSRLPSASGGWALVVS